MTRGYLGLAVFDRAFVAALGLLGGVGNVGSARSPLRLGGTAGALVTAAIAELGPLRPRRALMLLAGPVGAALVRRLRQRMLS